MSQTVKSTNLEDDDSPQDADRASPLGPLRPLRHRDVGAVRLLHGRGHHDAVPPARGVRVDRATRPPRSWSNYLMFVYATPLDRRLAGRPLPGLPPIGPDRRRLLRRRLLPAGPRLDRDLLPRPWPWSSPATGSSSRTSRRWSATSTRRQPRSRTRRTTSSTWASTSARCSRRSSPKGCSAHRRERGPRGGQGGQDAHRRSRRRACASGFLAAFFAAAAGHDARHRHLRGALPEAGRGGAPACSGGPRRAEELAVTEDVAPRRPRSRPSTRCPSGTGSSRCW